MFVFIDTVEGPRAPAVKPDESEGCSPKNSNRSFNSCKVFLLAKT